MFLKLSILTKLLFQLSDNITFLITNREQVANAKFEILKHFLRTVLPESPLFPTLYTRSSVRALHTVSQDYDTPFIKQFQVSLVMELAENLFSLSSRLRDASLSQYDLFGLVSNLQRVVVCLTNFLYHLIN